MTMPKEEGGMGAPIHCCGAAGKGNCEPGGCCACERGQASGEEASRFRFQGAGRHMEVPTVLPRVGQGRACSFGQGSGIRFALGLAGARGLARSAGEAPRACLRRPWRWLASIACTCACACCSWCREATWCCCASCACLLVESGELSTLGRHEASS